MRTLLTVAAWTWALTATLVLVSAPILSHRARKQARQRDTEPHDTAAQRNQITPNVAAMTAAQRRRQAA